MASPETKIRITGDPKGALTAIDKVKGGLTGLSATAARLPGFTALGSAVSGAFSAAAILNIAGAAQEVDRLAQVANAGTVEFQRYAAALSPVGVSAEKFADILKDVNDKIGDFVDTGGGPLADFFENIAPAVGVTADQFRRLSGPQALQLYFDSLEKANVSQERMTFYMEAIASDSTALIPLLKEGGKAFREAGDEAERAGAIIGESLSESSRKFNQNMVRLTTSLKGVTVSIGNEVIPVLTRLSDEFLAAQRAGLGFWESILHIGLSDPSKSPAENLKELRQRLAELNQERASGREKNRGLTLFDDLADEERIVKGLISYYDSLNKSRSDDGAGGDPSSEQAAAARKLADLEKQLGEARLKYARAVGAETKKANADQIKDAEKLRDALQKAWQESVDGARKAGEEAAALLKQAAEARADYQSKANARRSQDLSPEDQQAEAVSTASKATDDASFYAAAAQVAAIDGRAKAAADYAEKAKKLIDEASAATESIQDNETAAKNFERIGEAAEALKKAEAGLKQGESNQLTEQAAAQQKQIEKITVQLAELQKAAGAVEIKIDPEAAKKSIAELQAQIKALKEEAASVKVGGGATGSFSAGASGGFASGGFTGYGGKYAPAGIVHRGEYVFPQEAVKRLGINYLADLHKRGLRGYASGGLVSNLRVPNISAPTQAAGKTPVVLDFGALGRYSAAAAVAEVEGIERALRRAKLKGGRR